jgi:predicted transcriptional regulator
MGTPDLFTIASFFVNTLDNYTLDKRGFSCYIIVMKDIKDFIVTTKNGTRWAATGLSIEDVSRNWWGSQIGIEIASIELGRLFTHEEEAELRREKLEESCR